MGTSNFGGKPATYLRHNFYFHFYFNQQPWASWINSLRLYSANRQWSLKPSRWSLSESSYWTYASDDVLRFFPFQDWDSKSWSWIEICQLKGWKKNTIFKQSSLKRTSESMLQKNFLYEIRLVKSRSEVSKRGWKKWIDSRFRRVIIR